MGKSGKKDNHDRPLTREEESILQENTAVDPADQEKDYLQVECPNCRALPGKPCKWEDGSICYSRKVIHDIRVGKQGV